MEAPVPRRAGGGRHRPLGHRLAEGLGRRWGQERPGVRPTGGGRAPTTACRPGRSARERPGAGAPSTGGNTGTGCCSSRPQLQSQPRRESGSTTARHAMAETPPARRTEPVTRHRRPRPTGVPREAGASGSQALGWRSPCPGLPPLGVPQPCPRWPQDGVRACRLSGRRCLLQHKAVRPGSPDDARPTPYESRLTGENGDGGYQGP